MANEIIDLKKVRETRQIEKILEAASKFPGFKVNFDICDAPVSFSTYLGGSGKDKDEYEIGIVVYDTSGEYARPKGALHLKRGQWNALKAAVELILK